MNLSLSREFVGYHITNGAGNITNAAATKDVFFNAKNRRFPSSSKFSAGFPKFGYQFETWRYQHEISQSSSRGKVVFDASCQCCVDYAATGQEAKYTATFYDIGDIYRLGYVLVCAVMQMSSSDVKWAKVNNRR